MKRMCTQSTAGAAPRNTCKGSTWPSGPDTLYEVIEHEMYSKFRSSFWCDTGVCLICVLAATLHSRYCFGGMCALFLHL